MYVPFLSLCHSECALRQDGIQEHQKWSLKSSPSSFSCGVCGCLDDISVVQQTWHSLCWQHEALSDKTGLLLAQAALCSSPDTCCSSYSGLVSKASHRFYLNTFLLYTQTWTHLSCAYEVCSVRIIEGRLMRLCNWVENINIMKSNLPSDRLFFHYITIAVSQVAPWCSLFVLICVVEASHFSFLLKFSLSVLHLERLPVKSLDFIHDWLCQLAVRRQINLLFI